MSIQQHMKLIRTDSNSKLFLVENGLGSQSILFVGDKMWHVSGSIIMPNSTGEETYFDRNDKPEVLTAKWYGYSFTPITYCYCGNVKRIFGFHCKKCTDWSRAQR